MARAHGTGNITEVEKGRYRVRAYIGRDPVTGSPRFASKNVRGTKSDARAALNLLLADVAEKRSRGKDTPLKVAMLDWIEHAQALGRSQTTLDKYRLINSKWITPLLGNLALNKVDTYSVDKAVMTMSESLAPATVSNILAIIKAAFSQFVVWGWMPTNPATNAKVPQRASTERGVLTQPQVAAILRSAEADDPDWAAMIAVVALTGLRRGEACGLRWSDIDWQGKRITIERAYIPTDDGHKITATKTGKARTVLVDQALEFLDAHYRRQIDIYGAVHPDGYVFGIDGGATPPRPKTVTAFFSRHAKAAGVQGFRFHDLRHFSVTMGVGTGADVDTVARQHGHSTEVMLNVYSHADEDRARQMVSKMRLDATMPPIPEDRGQVVKRDEG